MLIHVNKLGLAAFIKMQGCPLLKTENDKTFVFESAKTVNEWRIEYSNSECSKHDALVCELRQHLPRGK